MRKREGNVGDLLITGICILAMTVVMLAYMDSVELLQQKSQVGQLARKYILRMETVGYLTAEDKTALTQALSDLGVTEIDYTDTTLSPVSFGEPILLRIQGNLKGEHAFEEHRASTAKN
ncbi:MAG: hypothetical protein J1E64_04670 [Acetatifactor sp.]|nr:hypothetical protein [Acetatifactor sp.]